MASGIYNIAITAGGTSEDVDGVRKLTNVSTGSLGWNCLEAVLKHFLSRSNSNFRVYYILTPTAFRGNLGEVEAEHVEFVNVTDAESVYVAVDRLTKRKRITHFIHSMAISDFTFSYAVSIDKLAEELTEYFVKNSSNVNSADIRKLLERPTNRYAEGAKISSKEPMLLGLKTTRKVISLIKKNNSDTVLVGFKLLRNVDEDTLVDVANRLTATNDCDFVFANELGSIEGDNHKGLLIKYNEIVARAKGKSLIAETIVENMLEDNELKTYL